MITKAKTLKNGLRVVFVDTKAFPSLTILLLVGAGSRYEDKKNNGVAHFFEHMAFKGSKKYPNSLIISSVVEGLGGIFNAFTGKDHTGYWIKAPVRHFETMVDVISDMVLHPLLLAEEIEREKGVIVEEINLYEDTPLRKVGSLFETLLYQENSLGFEITGSKKTATSFNRQTFVDYIKHLYQPKNAVLVVAGGLNKNATGPVSPFPHLLRLKSFGGQAASLGAARPSKRQRSGVGSPSRRATRRDEALAYYLAIIEEKFSAWKNGERAGFERAIDKQDKPQILLKQKKTEQAHFCLGFRAFSFLDKRRYALAVLSALLGGGMSSRLFIQVRERRGLCYYIYTDRSQYQDVGNLVSQAGVPIKLDKVKQAVEVILKEHKKIKKGEVVNQELSRVKEMLKGRLILRLEDSQEVAAFYGRRLLLEDKLKSPKEVRAEIDKVTVDDLIELASEIFVPERLNLAIIGPFEERREFEEALAL